VPELTIPERARRHALAASRLLERVEAAELEGRDPTVQRLNRDLGWMVKLAHAHAATSDALSSLPPA
jgi:hypothetical protein